MHFFTKNLFAELAARARSGDWTAKERFRRELERALVHVVRQTLRQGFGDTPLASCILEEARRIGPFDDFDALENQEAFVLDVVQGVCDGVMARMLRAPSRRFAGANTYCDRANEESCVAV